MSPDEHLDSIIESSDDADAAAGALASGATTDSRDGKYPGPLYRAAFCARERLVKLLVRSGATIAREGTLGFDSFGRVQSETSLHCAARKGHAAIVQALLDADGRSHLEHFDYLSQTPLIAAAANGRLAIVHLLLEAGANVNANHEFTVGDTAIKRAAHAGHVEIVRALLRVGADPTIPGWMRLTPVHEAQRGTTPGHAEILELIRQHLRLPADQWQKLLFPKHP